MLCIIKKPYTMIELFFRGEGGIRTPGTLLYAGFQDQCIRPLCHLSKSGLQKYKYFQSIKTLSNIIIF